MNKISSWKKIHMDDLFYIVLLINRVTGEQGHSRAKNHENAKNHIQTYCKHNHQLGP